MRRAGNPEFRREKWDTWDTTTTSVSSNFVLGRQDIKGEECGIHFRHKAGARKGGGFTAAVPRD